MAGLLSAAQLANITTVVASSLDQSLPRYSKSTASDGYGHKTETWNSQGNIACNIIKPSATQLQSFASIIGSQRALLLRVMSTATLNEGDRIVYDGLNWLVQNLQDAESYTVTKEYLITVVA
jgi:hypothetical protein